MTATRYSRNLWIGDWQDAKACEDRERLGQLHIMTVAKDSPFRSMTAIYPLVDGHEPENDAIFWNAVKHLQVCMMKDVPTLIHCVSGISRAPSVVIGFLMSEYHLSYEKALESVKLFRPCINPCPFFIDLLKNSNIESR